MKISQDHSRVGARVGLEAVQLMRGRRDMDTILDSLKGNAALEEG